ncbi:MAG: hypothetical protein MMC33_008395 [Icmadophila ericetorum]|nr:hypothetical protein [Icmadophila ericetorum]
MAGGDTVTKKAWEQVVEDIKEEKERQRRWVEDGSHPPAPLLDVMDWIHTVSRWMHMSPEQVELDIQIYGQRCKAAHNGVYLAVRSRNFHYIAMLGAKALKNVENILPDHLLPKRDMFDEIVKRFLEQYFSSARVVDDDTTAGWDVTYDLLPKWLSKPDKPSPGIELLGTATNGKLTKDNKYKQQKEERQVSKQARKEASRANLSQATPGKAEED